MRLGAEMIYWVSIRINNVASWARVAPVLGLRKPLIPLTSPVWVAQTMASFAQSETALPSGYSDKLPLTAGQPEKR